MSASGAATVLFDAPGPRARVRNHMITAVTVVVLVLVAWVVYSGLADKGQLTAEKWQPFLTANLWQTYVLPGIQGTLTAAAISIVLALILGLVLGVGGWHRMPLCGGSVRCWWSSSAPCPC